jgi:hypothetical protein
MGVVGREGDAVPLSVKGVRYVRLKLEGFRQGRKRQGFRFLLQRQG